MILSGIKRYLIRKKIPLSRMVFLEWIGMILLFFLLMSVMIFYGAGVKYLKEDYFYGSVLVFGIVFIFLCVYLKARCGKLLKYGKDIRLGHFREETVILTYSESLAKHRVFSIADAVLGISRWTESATYHKCRFRVIEKEDSEDLFFYFVADDKKRRILKQLLCAGVFCWETGPGIKRMVFERELPLKITFGAESHRLISVAPVDGCTYSDKERVWIKELNEWKLKRKKRVLVAEDPMRFALFFLFIYAAAISLCIFAFYFWAFCLVTEVMHWQVFGLPWSVRLEIIFYPLVFLFMGFVCVVFSVFELTLFASINYGEASLLGYFVRKNRKKIHRDVVFVRAEVPRRPWSSSLLFSWLFPEERPFLENCVCRRYQKDAENEYATPRDTYCLMVTESKIELLRQLCHCEVSFQYVAYEPVEEYTFHVNGRAPLNPGYSRYFSGSGILEGLSFEDPVPLRVFCRGRFSTIHSIAPVEGYAYTEAQLAAIDKFNTLYP